MTTTTKSGFTAVEVFLVLTMLAIVVGIFIVPAYNLADSFLHRPMEVKILSAIRKAHMYAKSQNKTVSLHYQSESNCFQVCSLDGIVLENVMIDDAGDDDRENAAEAAFYRLLPEDPKADVFAYELEDEPVDMIMFHPYGASTPFAVQFVVNKDEYCLIMDPFSSRPIMRMINGDET